MQPDLRVSPLGMEQASAHLLIQVAVTASEETYP